MTRTARGAGTGAPRSAQVLVGGLVLAISIAAFFRVPLLPALGAELSMTAGQLGLLTTAFAVGRLLTDIPAGRLADRLPPLRALGLAGLVLASGSLVLATARGAYWAIGAALLLGIASAVANTTGMTFFSSAAPARGRGASLAIFSAALLGGQAIGPLVGGVVAGATGWRIAIGLAVVVGLGVGAVGLTTRASRGLSSGAMRSAEEHRRPPSATAGAPPPRRQRLVLFAVSFSGFFMLGALPQTLVPIIGDDRYGLDAPSIGLALGLGGACRFIGALVGGRLSDRVSRKASLVPGMALGTLGVVALTLDLGVAGWVIGIVLLSLGSYGLSVGATMLADHARGTGVGRQLGSYRFVGDLGLVAGPTVAALLYERVSDDVALLTVAVLLGGVTLLCASVLQETRWLEEAPGP